MKSFLHTARPLITPLLVSTEEGALLREIAACLDAGVDAFGLCIERLPSELRTEQKIKTFFAAMGDKPIYVTCYLRGDAVEVILFWCVQIFDFQFKIVDSLRNENSLHIGEIGKDIGGVGQGRIANNKVAEFHKVVGVFENHCNIDFRFQINVVHCVVD